MIAYCFLTNTDSILDYLDLSIISAKRRTFFYVPFNYFAKYRRGVERST